MIGMADDYRRRRARTLGRRTVMSLTLLLLAAPGCLFTLIGGDCGLMMTVQGRVLDAASGTPITDATVGVSVLKKDEQGNYVALFLGSDKPGYAQPSVEDGTFTVTFVTLGPCPPITLPLPDRIEIVVQRDTCETTYTIDVSADTVVDLGTTSTPGSTTHALELKDPILVPACP